MKNILTLISLVLLTFCHAQERPSIHQEQLEQFRSQADPITDIAKVRDGIDVLMEDLSGELAGKVLALVTNHSGIDKNGIPNYRRLLELPETELRIIFSPEHGLFGEAAAGDKISYGDLEKDLPEVVSLYGKIRRPTAEMLEGVDIILYDIQDIGARFYTYISTLGLVMESAAEMGIPVWVLDRPNPIRGDLVEGPVIDMANRSFVGYYPIPIRYGLTVGELARMIVGEKWIGSIPELRVVAVEGWDRNRWFDQTDLPWVKPSPNIPDLETAIIYPGMCLIEGTNLSEGRGTYEPFKKIGAPWIKGRKLAQKLNQLELPGVVFRPVKFTPVSIPGMSGKPKHQDKKCQGIQITVTNRDRYNSMLVGIKVIEAVSDLYPGKLTFRESGMRRLWGSDTLVNFFNTDQAGSIESLLSNGVENYLCEFSRYFIY